MIRVDWRAGPDGFGHAVSRRTRGVLCGAERIQERYAWPVTLRCEPCRDALVRLVASEQRARLAAHYVERGGGAA